MDYSIGQLIKIEMNINDEFYLPKSYDALVTFNNYIPNRYKLCDHINKNIANFNKRESLKSN